MKLFIGLLVGIMVYSSASLACLPHPSFEVKEKNKLVYTLAQKYGADLKKGMEVANESFEIKWTYADSGYECHDTNIYQGTFTFKQKLFDQLCFVTVEARQVTQPVSEVGPVTTEVEYLNEQKDCLAKPL